jgi:hypothetical protein
MDEFDKALIEAQDQKGDAWRDIRSGRFTSSGIHALLGDPKTKEAKAAGKWSDGAETYIHTKVAEQLTGLVTESPRSNSIQWGEDYEPFARELYETITGIKIVKSGFSVYGDHAGGSPDGFKGDDAFLEIKCPYNPANQIDYLNLTKGSELKELHADYWTQIQCNMLFTGRKKCIFIAFDPRFPSEKQKIKILEIGPDQERQDLIVQRLEKAIVTKLEIVKSLS